MVVCSPEDGKYKAVAEEIASERNEPLVEDVDAALNETGPVVYVSPPESLDDATVLKFQQRLEEKGPRDGGFGIITGYTPTDARELYHRDTEGGRDSVMFLSGLPDDVSFDEDVDAHFGNDVTVSELEPATDERFRSLSIKVHAWTIHLNFADGFVCGFPETVDVEEYDGRQPRCVQDGEMDCPYDEDLLAAENLKISHPFLGACASMINNNINELPVHVGLGMLRNAESLLGPYRPVATDPIEPVFYHSLIRAGYGVSERCYLINEFSHGVGEENYPYLPFGRPSAGPDPVGQQEYEASVENDERGVCVEVTDVDAHVIDVTIPLDRVPTTDDRWYVQHLTADDDSSSLFYICTREGDSLRLVACTGKRMNRDRIRLLVRDEPVTATERNVAFESIENVKRNRNIYPDSIEPQLESLDNQIQKLPKTMFRERYNAEVHPETDEMLRSAVGNVDAIADKIHEFTSGGELLRKQYTDFVHDGAYTSEQQCSSCDRPLFVKIGSPKTDLDRAMGDCPRCGQVYDVPVEGEDPTPPRPIVTTDNATGSRYRDVQVEFENPLETEMRALLSPFVVRTGTGMNGDERPIEPESVRETLEPGERVTETFTVDSAQVDGDRFRVGVRAIGNLEVYTGVAWLLPPEE